MSIKLIRVYKYINKIIQHVTYSFLVFSRVKTGKHHILHLILPVLYPILLLYNNRMGGEKFDKVSKNKSISYK